MWCRDFEERRLDLSGGEAGVVVGFLGGRGTTVRGDWLKLFLEIVLVCNKMLALVIWAPLTLPSHPHCGSPLLRALGQGEVGAGPSPQRL